MPATIIRHDLAQPAVAAFTHQGRVVVVVDERVDAATLATAADLLARRADLAGCPTAPWMAAVADYARTHPAGAAVQPVTLP